MEHSYKPLGYEQWHCATFHWSYKLISRNTQNVFFSNRLKCNYAGTLQSLRYSYWRDGALETDFGASQHHHASMQTYEPIDRFELSHFKVVALSVVHGSWTERFFPACYFLPVMSARISLSWLRHVCVCITSLGRDHNFNLFRYRK